MTKYVKLMPDYCSSGLWTINGAMMEWSSLPVSEELKDRIHLWVSDYDQNNPTFDDDEVDPDVFDIGFHSAQGVELAKEIKRELPDWTVVYFNESLINRDGPRTEYEYEIVDPNWDDPMGCSKERRRMGLPLANGCLKCFRTGECK